MRYKNNNNYARSNIIGKGTSVRPHELPVGTYLLHYRKWRIFVIIPIRRKS